MNDLEKETALKTLLIEAWEKEKGLIEFCCACLKKIYGEESLIAIHEFKEGVEAFSYCGCIQSLEIIEARMEKNKNKQNN